MAKASKVLVAVAAAAAACHFLLTSFVPPAGRGLQIGTAARSVTALGAAPAPAEGQAVRGGAPSERSTERSEVNSSSMATLAVALGLLMGLLGNQLPSLAAPEDAPTLKDFMATFQKQQDDAKRMREEREKNPFKKIEEMKELAVLMADFQTISTSLDDQNLKDDLFKAADKLSSNAPAPATGNEPDMSFEELMASMKKK
eukprot:CAMPEP_0197625606 /NCGR_PEP_ID=MMETSP1338-20131121/4923_1 /TAXON_ID=43686 ORGANISM="Pelagodinium beii, Strain RCC1491" /NCGR_SAMPLE_ID=MMETSP1338 /ASSEMBLY_ACC=CAM_ASM_000754 /LENGTH=199 /DNA_ID=CAMNT_0043196055 /DNA_START=78 /DNA_END=677 /DNA_ORIENTATION=+